MLSVGIGYAATCFFKSCDQYSWTDAAVDFGVGFASSGLSSPKYLKYAKEASAASNATRLGGRAAAEVAVETTGEVIRHEAKGEDYSVADLVTEAAAGAALGELGDAAGRGIKESRKRAGDALGDAGDLGAKPAKSAADDVDGGVPTQNRTPSKETVITGESPTRPGVGAVAEDATGTSVARSAPDAPVTTHAEAGTATPRADAPIREPITDPARLLPAPSTARFPGDIAVNPSSD